jgi:ketopantoate reductase
LKLKVQELGDRWQGIRQATADTFIDMAINGNSFKDIWKKLWADLAKEAIYRLLQVKTQASLLGSIFNLLGPKAGVIGSAEMAEIDVAAANVPLEIMHSGGVVGGSNPVVPYLKSDEVNRTLQVGEEVNSIKDRRTTEIMADQNKYLMDKLESVSQNGQPVQFTIVTPDTGSFAEYLRQHGDVLVNILREQGGLRNNT